MSPTVWLGLLISLASSLVACFAKLKFPRGVRVWSRAFSLRNSTTLLSASLALLGFATAAFGVLEAKTRARAAQEALAAENRALQSLVLEGKTVAPTYAISIETAKKDVSMKLLDEQSRWEDAGALAKVPPPIGYMSMNLRAFMFAGARPEPLLRYLGEVVIGDRPSARFRVRDDGSVQTGASQPTTTQFQELFIPGSIATIEASVSERIDSLEIYYSMLRLYDRGRPALRVRVFGADQGPDTAQAGRPLSPASEGRLTVFLNDKRQLALTGRIRLNETLRAQGEIDYRWHFAEAPRVEVFRRGGLK